MVELHDLLSGHCVDVASILKPLLLQFKPIHQDFEVMHVETLLLICIYSRVLEQTLCLYYVLRHIAGPREGPHS